MNALAFSPDARTLITGCDDGYARLWEIRSGKPSSPVVRHEGPVLSVTFSPDGRMIATGSVDGTARLWDVTTGRSIGQPMRHD